MPNSQINELLDAITIEAEYRRCFVFLLAYLLEKIVSRKKNNGSKKTKEY